MASKNRLSLCVITQNDERYISNCLRDMMDIADEIIVADLGSSDRTAELAREFGAAVYPVKLENDYSRIRNFCMDQAGGRWVLFLQADEVIEEEQRKEIRRLLDNPNAEGYLLYIEYNPEERGISSPAQMLRLLRNRKEYRFQYRSFEYIPDEIMTGIIDSDLKITHRGRRTVSRQIRTRISLLKEEAEENPEDAYLQYLFGIELLNSGKYEESLPYLEKARKTVNWGYLYAPHLYKCLGWAYLYLERYTQAREALDEGVENFVFYTDLLILRAELSRQLGMFEEARQDLMNCIRLREQPCLSVPSPEIDDDIVKGMLNELAEAEK
jgi:glycosyltransferase involved in cell wall biosynthesis